MKLLKEKNTFLTSREIILKKSPTNKKNVADIYLSKIIFNCFQLVIGDSRMHSDKLYTNGVQTLLPQAASVADTKVV